jgi:aspartyl-tRNA(Asn)/glutamyl-tRNA(Gln) amidotransferase subunit A
MSGAENTTYAKDAGRVQELASAIASGALSPVELVERCLARIEAVDPHVQAWRRVDGERALAIARVREAEARAGTLRGALHGIPFGIKDVIDAEGLDTLCNSRSREGIAPANADAEQVAAMKVAGAIVLGKVHTTEFAYFDPPPTCNPHHLGHTPGGSSGGSAAAVAAGTVPVTLGTQTLASVNRPAAYCGIAAFKPSSRALGTFGVTALGPGSDTVGFFGATVADALTVFDAIKPAYLQAWRKPAGDGRDRIVFIEDAHLDAMQPGVMEACTETLAMFADRGAVVEKRPSPVSFARLEALQLATMNYEIGRTLRYLLDLPADRIGTRLRAGIEAGLTITQERYLSARADMDRLRRAFYSAFADVDAFLWPAAPGPAPEGLASTGDPRFIAPWTALGGPIVTVPAGRAANGLPLGCILIGVPGGDADLSALARRLC